MAFQSDKLLFTRYYKTLCYFAFQMVKDQNLAEDLAQDAFVSYFQNKPAVADDERAIKTFLYSSVKFAVYNLSRKSKTVRKFWERKGFQEFDETDYEHQIIRTEFMQAINEALQNLPEGCRKIMSMSYLEGLSNDEIAGQLDLSINTIKTQKKRGLSVLRDKLRPDYLTLLLAVFFLR